MREPRTADGVPYGGLVHGLGPGAAEAARGIAFDPTQEVFDEPDESWRVELTASGWLGMTWYLYQWGDTPEVIGPVELREMVQGYQRGDVGMLP